MGHGYDSIQIFTNHINIYTFRFVELELAWSSLELRGKMILRKGKSTWLLRYNLPAFMKKIEGKCKHFMQL